MSGKDPDQDLRELFQAARREEASRVPAFSRLWESAHKRRVSRKGRFVTRVLLPAAAVLLVAVFVLLRSDRSPVHESHGLAGPSITDWKAPTDFLMRTPARELLRALPEIGTGRSPLLELNPPPSPEERSTPS